MKLDLDLILYTDVNSEWIKGLNIRPESLYLLEENVQERLLDIVSRQLFFAFHSKRTGNKGENKQVGLKQSIKFLHSRRNNEQGFPSG